MKKIIITNESLIVNRRNIQWEEIVGIRSFDSWLLHQFCLRCPFCELFLNGGRAIRIPAKFNLEGIPLEKFNDKYMDSYSEYFTTIRVISERSKNLKTDLSNWMEWRLVLPGALVELIVLIVGFFIKKDFPDIVAYGLIAGILFVPVGWFWERAARKNKWN